MQALAEVIDHLVRHEVFRIGPVVVTTTVVNTWMIMAVLFAVVYLLTRNLSDKPKGAQALLEVVVELFYGLIDTGMGGQGASTCRSSARSLSLLLSSTSLGLSLTWCRPRRI